MSDFKFNFSDGKDAILELPDGIELSYSEKIALVGYGLQKAILDGATKVTSRVWPCLVCGNRTFTEQKRLIKHFEKEHADLDEKIKTLLDSKSEKGKG